LAHAPATFALANVHIIFLSLRSG